MNMAENVTVDDWTAKFQINARNDVVVVEKEGGGIMLSMLRCLSEKTSL